MSPPRRSRAHSAPRNDETKPEFVILIPPFLGGRRISNLGFMQMPDWRLPLTKSSRGKHICSACSQSANGGRLVIFYFQFPETDLIFM